MSETARKRSRIACVSCQSRKRKCTGDQPCSTCCQFGIDCHYDLLSRKKKDARSFRPQQSIPPIVSTTSRNESIPKSHREGTKGDSPDIPVSSLEANSGAAFVRRLGLKIDPANAPRLDLFAWNVGARHPTPSPMPPSSMPRAVSVVDIISLEEMKLLAATFFEKVDPCYGFIDREHLFRQLGRRWLPTSSESVLPYGPYDAVLCGVAAFGYLFSRRQAPQAELQLAETARLILDQHMLSEKPSSVDIVTGWVLRVAYLRTTAAPDAAWMASCSLMHLIEATGLHLEPSSDTVLGQSAETCEPEIRRRLFAMRAILTEIFNLLPISESLDPNKAQDSLDLESALVNVLEIVHPLASHTLAQCNLMLCIYRRLRGLDTVISGPLLDQVLELARKGLQASRNMIASISPWHQTANVPFQIICTLLAIDSRASLALLGDAMQTLREVALAYDTDVMREAYSTAYLLILLHQRRKEEDARTLRGVLRANSAASAPQAEITEPTIESTHSLADYPGFSWLSDLVIDMPGLQNFDLESFLATDNSWPLPEPGM
ncbi:C6 transcription factor [Aspergillus bombycis]|uniref:C6 transcription factor n=1 Tax=Aspergillus bombycis TaxID=109264 RepID=A0A1F8AFQ3_9EURO|nr:C6 transcription factor [Aspergillus bombycis]OGM50239.1 C6 transcription factor [Aspergillus bombycis]